MFSPLPPSIRQERFPSEFVRPDDEGTVWLGVADVNDLSVSTPRRLPNRHAGAVSPRTVFSWIRQDLLHLFFLDIVIPDVRLTCCGIEVEAEVHRHQYRN